jgi:hypothetical protein
VASPLFILAPPRSFTSVIGTMVGQHPQLYGLPETKLLGFESMAEWWRRCQTWPMMHGLLRALAELYFGGQNRPNVTRALGWLRRRLHLSTGAVMESLAQRVAPLILVEKSPLIVVRIESMRRAQALFPDARFIHLLRHPRAQGDSILKVDSVIQEDLPGAPLMKWVERFGSYPPAPPAPGEEPEPPASPGSIDPQWGWYAQHRNILDFLEEVPPEQVLRIRGEDVLTDPDSALFSLATWLGLRADAAAIDEMKHPERSPYACIGPHGARYGNDLLFLRSPALRPARAESKSLDGPLPWRTDGRGFAPAVRRLAQEFGYT